MYNCLHFFSIVLLYFKVNCIADLMCSCPLVINFKYQSGCDPFAVTKSTMCNSTLLDIMQSYKTCLVRYGDEICASVSHSSIYTY